MGKQTFTFTTNLTLLTFTTLAYPEGIEKVQQLAVLRVHLYNKSGAVYLVLNSQTSIAVCKLIRLIGH